MHPKLRPLDIRPTLHQGQPTLLLRDPLELSGQYMLLPQALGPALMLCDGKHDIDAIHEVLVAQFGIRIERAVVQELAEALDLALFLENERSGAAMLAAVEDYRAAPYRTPIGAGVSYPAEPDELRQLFDHYLDAVGDVEIMPHTGKVVLSPHIDYQRGGEVYARVWKQTAGMVNAADLVVVLATDHHAGYNPITLTRQNYATPYGILPTALDVVDALSEAIGAERAFSGELYHTREHSIELVVTWLHHMRGGRPVEIVPILTGSFHPYIENGSTPLSNPAFCALLDTLQQATAGRNVLVVASGDLAHIGPTFGGDPVGIVERADLRALDDELVGHLAAGDAEAFWQVIKREQDRTNVCGVSPFYLSLKLAGPVEGRRAGYAICPADEYDTSVVSVCGVVLG